MRARANKASALQDKTPGNTPQSKKDRRARSASKGIFSSAKKPLASLSIHGRRLDTDTVLPRSFLTSQSDVLVSPTPGGPVLESTPLTRRHHRARMPHKSVKPVPKLPISPLPPSSPPSSDDEELPHTTNAPIPLRFDQIAEDDDGTSVGGEDKENDENAPLLLAEAFVDEEVQEDASGDDPFGFLAVERELKVRRETQTRSSAVPAPVVEAKVTRPRAPFDILHQEPLVSSPPSHRRPPTPYHPSDDLRQSDGLPRSDDVRQSDVVARSDDLEDMYADPAEFIRETANTPGGKGNLVDEMAEEERAAAENVEGEGEEEENVPAAPPSAPPTPDPLRTPQPHHVANISPITSPFSSAEGTPCDRSLAGSLPSSPSPTKPLSFLQPLPGTVKKGPWSERAKGLPTPFTSVKARASATRAKENTLTSEATIISSPSLNRLPKRSTKPPSRTIATATAAITSSAARPRRAVAAKGKGKEKQQELEAEPEPELVQVDEGVSEMEEEVVDETPLAKKRKAAPKPQPSRKRAKVEVLVPLPPRTRAAAAAARTAKPPPTSTSVAPRSKDKGRAVATKPKAKAKAKAVEESEDSDEARRRRARIEYFKKLDSYSLPKENVYVV